MMNGLTLVCIAIVIFAFAYLFYGRWLVKTWGIDPNAVTPAVEKEDGVDYVPSPMPRRPPIALKMAATLRRLPGLRSLPISFLQLRAQALSRARLLPLCLVGFLHSYGLL